MLVTSYGDGKASSSHRRLQGSNCIQLTTHQSLIFGVCGIFSTGGVGTGGVQTIPRVAKSIPAKPKVKRVVLGNLVYDCQNPIEFFLLFLPTIEFYIIINYIFYTGNDSCKTKYLSPTFYAVFHCRALN